MHSIYHFYFGMRPNWLFCDSERVCYSKLKLFPRFWTRDIIEWKTPTTYIIAFISQLICGAYVLMVAAILLTYGIGSVLLCIAFLDDIHVDLNSLNEYHKFEQTDAKLFKHLCEFITFHSEIKQLSVWPMSSSQMSSNFYFLPFLEFLHEFARSTVWYSQQIFYGH